jgi:hypothetical protein
MGFFLPVNAQISKEQFSIEIYLQSVNTGIFALKLRAKVFVTLSFDYLIPFKMELSKNHNKIYIFISNNYFRMMLKI